MNILIILLPAHNLLLPSNVENLIQSLFTFRYCLQRELGIFQNILVPIVCVSSVPANILNLFQNTLIVLVPNSLKSTILLSSVVFVAAL